MKKLIDFSPPPPEDAPKKEHREYNKSVRKAYANARKEEKEYFEEILKKAKNGDANAMAQVALRYQILGEAKKHEFWLSKINENKGIEK